MPNPVNRAAERIRQLEALLLQSEDEQARVDVLIELGWELRMNQPEQAKSMAAQALELSQNGVFLAENYNKGMSGCQVILAFVETYAGELDKAVARCLQVLNQSRDEPDLWNICALYTISWAHFFLGDYATAMENALQALKISREFKSRLMEAWVLDVLASLYGIAGNFSLALESHCDSVAIFDSLDEIQGKIRSLNNMAYTLHMMKNSEEAFGYARQGLELALQYALINETFNLYCTLAQILITQGHLDKAEGYLQDALSAWTVFGETNVSQVYVLLEWGNLCRLKNDLASAESYFRKALALATKLGQQAEQAQCHLRLSELHQIQANCHLALESYKTYHALMETVTGERASQRLAAYQATYQVEAARHVAEIYRLESLQLQREIEHQKEIRDSLEYLSRIDGLTGLANRRSFDEKLLLEYSRLARSGGELSIILLDVDHFKAYNDMYGHLQGDECLKQIAGVLKTVAARSADLAARYGGEEFVCILPDTGEQGAIALAEKIRQAVVALGIIHERSNAANYVTVSIGVATARCYPGGLENRLVAAADQQLYLSKNNGRNQINASSVLNNEKLTE